MTDTLNFGKNLRIIRLAKGINQEAMALSLNISQSRYSRIEREKLLPEKHLIREAARTLGIYESDLMLPSQEVERLFQNKVQKTFEDYAQEALKTPIGLIMSIALSVPTVDAAYNLGDGIATTAGAPEQLVETIRFLTGFLVFVYLIYWIVKTRSRKS